MARPWRDPNEPRREKREFFKKPKAEKTFVAKAGAKPTPKDPYQDGMLRMFLDDERDSPPGFTLYRDLGAFEQALKTVDLSTIYSISLDWYLGVGIKNGHAAAALLAEMLATRRKEFTNLRIITCHSSDIEEAVKMARTLAEPVREEAFSDDPDAPYVIIDVGRAIGKI